MQARIGSAGWPPASRCPLTPLVALLMMGALSCSSSRAPAPPPVPVVPATSVAQHPQTASRPEAAIGRVLTGTAIEDWFRGRGVEPPRSLDSSEARCSTVRARVPSGQALSCEQSSTIDEWATVTRHILYDVRGGRTLALMNLVSEVLPAKDNGPACGGALTRLNLELSDAGDALTVTDDPACRCEGNADALARRAQEVRAAGKTRGATALEFQAQQVKAACAQLGEYQWSDHGFVPSE